MPESLCHALPPAATVPHGQAVRSSSLPRLAALLMTVGCSGLLSHVAQGAEASISLTIVTEPGVNVTAPREWLQLVSELGISQVRVRGARAGDQPKLDRSGSDERPYYRVVGLLSPRNELLLPGGKFTRRSRGELADYFARLRADGSEGVTAETGRFGLTEQQFRTVHADLSQPIGIATTGLPMKTVLAQLEPRLQLDLVVDPAVERQLQQAAAATDAVQTLSVGTALALLLRRDGLVVVPEKRLGQPPQLRVVRQQEVTGETWPVGWPSDAPPSQLAPGLMETLNAEIDRFTLQEAIDAIAPRIGVPVYWDHATLQAKGINPTQLPVQFGPRRTHLKRVVDSLLFQARLSGELRIDEGGTAFYWISR